MIILAVTMIILVVETILMEAMMTIQETETLAEEMITPEVTAALMTVVIQKMAPERMSL